MVSHPTYLPGLASSGFTIFTHQIPFQERTLSPQKRFTELSAGWEGGFQRASLKEHTAPLKGWAWLVFWDVVNCLLGMKPGEWKRGGSCTLGPALRANEPE